MAITDHKISGLDPARESALATANISQVHVEAQATVLQGSANQNKQVFDNYPDMIVAHFNAALEEISNDTSAEIDRDVLDLYLSLGWTPDNN